MMMSDSEICASYQNAKNKNQQIEILAELNATDRDSIKQILKYGGELLGKRGPKPKGTNVPEQKEVPKMPEEPKEAAAEEKPEEAAVVPHIRVPIPPVVIEAVEEKLSDLETKIRYHEDQLTLLNHQYKEIVDYLQAEGKL